ncbi:MAG: hypothetical protein ACK4S3_08625 [Parvibaculum sp.]
MARTCIICGLKAGSREHLFPAGLGGRRTNKGIYCGKHNNDYSTLAGVLATQFNIMNAHIGVQGDHASAPTRREIVDAASGRPYRFSRTKSEWSGPRHTASGDGSGIVVEARSRAEAIDYARKLGLTPDDTDFTAETRRQFFLSPVYEELTFGGAEGLRAIAYVAQTFFAHHFPELARTAMLDGVKAYTLKGGDNHYAWWEFEPIPDLAQNPFPFGHRIVVGMDGCQAYARVELFSALRFAVWLGACTDSAANRSVVTDIDPLALRPPKDIIETGFSGAVGKVKRPVDLTTHLRRAVSDRTAEVQLNDLFRRIARVQLDDTVAEIRARLDAASGQDRYERERLMFEIAEGQKQRLLGLMREGVGGLAKEFGKRTETASLAEAFKLLIASDPGAPDGLTPVASASLVLAAHAVAAEMVHDHEAGRLSDDRLAALLARGEGLEVVTRAVIEPVLAHCGLA